ncbi:MAG TPA: ATP-binding protein [Chloroflexota bacterium]|nr:ATP-binding protein [Chloroflexota bacterium]
MRDTLPAPLAGDRRPRQPRVDSYSRTARTYIVAAWCVGSAVLLVSLFRLSATGTHLLTALLFAALAALADLKRLRLRGASYSVATATNFACAILLGGDAAVSAAAVGALAGDLGTRKPLHRSLFNTAAVGLSVAVGSAAMAALRLPATAPSPADLPAFAAYALVHALINQALVCTVIALTTRTPIRRVVAANFSGMLLPIVALYPLGVLMAVVYASFGQWVGLLLLVVPVIAAYGSLDKARRLRAANVELEAAARRSAALYDELRAAHAQLTTSKDEVLDINRRLRQALADLQAAQEQVVGQERLRALGQMASGVAHDFNNALSPVVGFSELLLLERESWKDEAFLAEHLQLINTAARDAASVVRQMREFYRPREEDELLLPVDLNAIVRQAIEITQARWKDQPLARGLTITASAELAAVPPVLADQAALREVLINLIFNAVDAMPDGGALTLRTRAAGGAAVLEVADTGTGMTEDVRRRCLDPFFTTKGTRGTGMGLSMVHGIVGRHGGTLEIETAVGRGTTMRITLPAAPVDDGQAALPGSGALIGAELAPPAAGGPAGAPPSPALRILVVDDQAAVRDVLESYIASCGHVAETAPDAHEGLRLLETSKFDVLVTDQAMPGMSGDAFAAAVRRTHPRLPIMMLTGFADQIRANDGPSPDVDLLLAKPILHRDFRMAIEALACRSS